MNRWRIAVAGIALTAAVAGEAVAVWAMSGDEAAACDPAALSRSLADDMQRAGAEGDTQFMPRTSPGCGEADMRMAMQEMTRDWHMMPGGMMMRRPDHMGR